MSATEIVNDQMERMRSELATANQQIGVILECVDLQEKIFSTIVASPNGMLLDELRYTELLNLSQHIHSACKRA